jgi:hypothetical protein
LDFTKPAALLVNCSEDERRFLEEVLLPAASRRESASQVVRCWQIWHRRTGIGIQPAIRGLPHAILSALIGLEFDGAKDTPTYRLLKQAHRLVYEVDGDAWRRGPDFYARLATAG